MTMQTSVHLRTHSMKLSLLIPTYNRCAALRETLEAFLPQLMEGVELVVVDGASPDATAAVVGEFVQQSPHIR
ncbi:MAG: glycosyltransferase, partial [Myxococcales bacterium]|nr:glycosyltransferase [Myxococcales bacterium]